MVDTFIKDLVLTVRLVLLGRTEAISETLLENRVEKFLLLEMLVGLLIGIQTFSVTKALAFPIFLVGATTVWLMVYALISKTPKEEMPILHSYFFGTSLFLAPSAVPLIGPLLLPVFAIGWPFVLARLIAYKKSQPPGRVFLELTLPLIAFWLLVQFAIWMLGTVISL